MPSRCERMRKMQLVMGLRVIVCLIFVGEFVDASVDGEHLLGDPVPGLIVTFLPCKNVSEQQRIPTVPRPGEEKRSEVGECSIDVAVALDLRQTAVKAESVRNQPSTQSDGVFQGIIRANR